MEVILLERVEKLGQMGDVVTVKNGFARNFLLPRRKALRATKANITGFENQRSQYEAQNIEHRKEANSIATKIDGIELIVIRQASESGQLYGSVVARDIASGVIDKGFTIDRRQVEMPGPIKSLGIHDIRIVLHPEVLVNVQVNVARSPEEAVAQTAGRAAELKEGQNPESDLGEFFEDKALAAKAAEEIEDGDEAAADLEKAGTTDASASSKNPSTANPTT